MMIYLSQSAVFHDNQHIATHIKPPHIKAMVDLLAERTTGITGIMHALRCTTKIPSQNLRLQHNQQLIMKYVMSHREEIVVFAMQGMMSVPERPGFQRVGRDSVGRLGRVSSDGAATGGEHDGVPSGICGAARSLSSYVIPADFPELRRGG